MVSIQVKLGEFIGNLHGNNVREKVGWNIFVRHEFYILFRSRLGSIIYSWVIYT